MKSSVTPVSVVATMLLAICAAIHPAEAGENPPGAGSRSDATMDNRRLGELLERLDENVQGRPGYWLATVWDRAIIVITDERADRMRIISGVASAEGLDRDLLYRVMQANFDTALDARYSIAQGTLWSMYLHPLGSLTDEQFISAIGQVINLAMTFGTTYSSGGLTFGGGDSGELIQELLEKGLSI